jgi:putative (di)nucleoside polyphosphate hydrolase
MNTPDPALPYRPCVGVMLVNRAGLAFVGKRIDNKEGDWWQMPQGGDRRGRRPATGSMLRELWEETGVRRKHHVHHRPTREELLYDLPDDLIGKLWGGRYRGQRQHWSWCAFPGRTPTSTSTPRAAGILRMEMGRARSCCRT